MSSEIIIGILLGLFIIILSAMAMSETRRRKASKYVRLLTPLDSKKHLHKPTPGTPHSTDSRE